MLALSVQKIKIKKGVNRQFPKAKRMCIQCRAVFKCKLLKDQFNFRRNSKFL